MQNRSSPRLESIREVGAALAAAHIMPRWVTGEVDALGARWDTLRKEVSGGSPSSLTDRSSREDRKQYRNFKSDIALDDEFKRISNRFTDSTPTSRKTPKCGDAVGKNFLIIERSRPLLHGAAPRRREAFPLSISMRV